MIGYVDEHLLTLVTSVRSVDKIINPPTSIPSMNSQTWPFRANVSKSDMTGKFGLEYDRINRNESSAMIIPRARKTQRRLGSASA